MMRFLANENFPLASVKALRNAGYDVASVIEIMPGAKDESVLEYAHQESQIILTFDRDYGELIYRYQLPMPAGVIYLRFVPQTPEEPSEFILRLLIEQIVSLEGRFTVAGRDRIRQRPLPHKSQ
jgi:predicted nuclease of predicted toxin-antitoxin system